MDKVINAILFWIFISIVMILFTGCTRYQGTSTMILDDLDVKYEITKSIPYHPNADAVYVEDEDKIYVKKGKQSVYLILHELVHKFRSNKEISLGFDDPVMHKLEEAIAVKAALKICKLAGIRTGIGKYQIPALISRTWKVNGLERSPLSKEQNIIVDIEIEKTIDVFEAILKEKGRSLKEIDWAKTAILLLL